MKSTHCFYKNIIYAVHASLSIKTYTLCNVTALERQELIDRFTDRTCSFYSWIERQKFHTYLKISIEQSTVTQTFPHFYFDLRLISNPISTSRHWSHETRERTKGGKVTNGAKIREGRFKCLEEFTCRGIATIYSRLMNVVSKVAVADTERKPRKDRRGR